jgi:L-alanine-DL-glutamate epimerase-like enolase superfamily enzyme
MKITNVETIRFKTMTRHQRTKWIGIMILDREVETVESVTRIATDEGVEGYMLGGRKDVIEREIKPLLVGENPLDREKLWHWMDQICALRHNFTERDMGVVDCALWDLAGRMAGLPVHKLLGGCRDKVKAYASSFDHLGGPDAYAKHVRACQKQGFKAYKVHAYVSWDPHANRPAPLQPGFPKEDVVVCRAVREAAGDDMVLLLDPFASYTLEEALWVGRELEKLHFYWLEHPMMETRIEPYRRLTRELDINILSPEHVPGGIFTRVEWILQGASDMLRIDYNYGGLTACYKLAIACQAHGIKCELHGGGWAHLQVLGATPESTCEYYERGLMHPDVDYDKPRPYLKATCDPTDGKGNVIIPTGPGLGMEFDWDYMKRNRVD